MRPLLIFALFILLPTLAAIWFATSLNYAGAGTMMIYALIAAYVCGFAQGYDCNDPEWD